MFGEKLKEIRKKQGYTLEELANIYNKTYNGGLNKGTLSKYENGKQEPMITVVDNLATLLNVGIDYLLGKPSSPTISKGVSIPVLGTVIAGVPVEAIEDILGYEEITRELASTGEFFALQIKDDSMAPRMQAGDVVIVKTQSDIKSGEIAIVIVNGNESTYKQVIKFDLGINLVSFNPNYPPTFYSNKDIVTLPVVVVGRVIELRSKL